MPFLDSLDIGNRACVHLAVPLINGPTEDSVANQQMSFAYDKLRRAELRRNTWRFTTRRTAIRPISLTAMLISPALYGASTLYLIGSIVKDVNGILWISVKPENQGNEPGTTDAWDQYFGPMTADIYNSGTTYFTGELVYVPVGDPGTFVLFMSRISGNADAPNVATPYSAAVQYGIDALVSFGGQQWRSLIAVNKGITPAAGPAAWNPIVSYSTAQSVVAQDGYIYTSVGSGNLNHDPATDGGVHWTNTHVANAWSNSPTLYPSSSSWLSIYSDLAPLALVYPVGSGPVEQEATRNVYHLPANYLREAPQDPKAGSVSALGAPSGLFYTDWLFEGDYLVTRNRDVIVFRFVADFATVSQMDDMFCEGLAARMAYETCEQITQSTSKQQIAAQAYNKFMSEARTVNGIETGPIEPPEDDLISCRL